MPLAMPMLVLAAFGLAAVYNFLAARGIRLVVEGSPHRAAMADFALDLMGRAFLVGLILVGPWLVVPELIGGYVGTYYGTRRTPAPSP